VVEEEDNSLLHSFPDLRIIICEKIIDTRLHSISEKFKEKWTFRNPELIRIEKKI